VRIRSEWPGITLGLEEHESRRTLRWPRARSSPLSSPRSSRCTSETPWGINPKRLTTIVHLRALHVAYTGPLVNGPFNRRTEDNGTTGAPLSVQWHARYGSLIQAQIAEYLRRFSMLN
jgi:hypothetical protein